MYQYGRIKQGKLLDAENAEGRAKGNMAEF